MEFLSKELEELLKLCIDNQSGYPNILCEEFRKCNNNVDDERLRSKIKALIDAGYLSNISWADNYPYMGRIEQKGFDYFKQCEIYIRAKLRQDPYFSVLDEECESELKAIAIRIDESGETFIPIIGVHARGRVIEHLYNCGYISLGERGVSYNSSGFVAFVALTQKGLHYFEDKEARIEEIKLLGDSAFIVNNIKNQFIGNTVTESAIQVGDNNEQTVNFEDYGQKIAELKDEINNLKLSNEQEKSISSLITQAEDACRKKQAKTLKNVLKGIWDFAIATGSGLLASFLAMKFGIS